MRRNPVTAKDVLVENTVELDGVKGRTIDLTVRIRPESYSSYRKLEIRLASDGNVYTSLIYRPAECTLEFDRSNSGTRRATSHTRKCSVAENNGKIKLRIIMDRYSVKYLSMTVNRHCRMSSTHTRKRTESVSSTTTSEH